MPPELLEKKLYGYIEGSYTQSANPIKKGLFEIAHTGTLFFDKITELNMYGQLSLLKAVRDGNIFRIGDDRALPVNIRIICSVNKNILNLVREGKFNEDLYYMLNVLSLYIPPLRERKDDIESALEHYIEHYNNMYRKYEILTDGAKEIVLSYPWHGNVQQLKKFCERLIILAPKKVLNEDFIIKCLESHIPSFDENKASIPESEKKGIVYKSPEAARILELLEAHNGNRGKVAEEMDVSKATLWRKMKKFNIESKFEF
jgi:transcriptional regulator with PAS, ATPase and Fis domain